MKTALVVGAASGIGEAIADTLDEMEFAVVRADIAFQPNQDSRKRHLDATDITSITTLKNYLHAEFNKIDYLVITIGAIDEGEAIDYPEKSLSWILDINLLAPYRLIQNLIDLLRSSDSAKILLTGSSAGLGLFDDTSKLMPYIISKHGLMGLFKALRQDLAKEGVQVSILLPNRVAGKLSENSVAMRKRHLGEEPVEAKGSRKSNDILVEPHAVAREFVEKFLKGKTYISNNAEMIINKLQAELAEIQKDLLS